jgi:hypothetical protein
MPVWAIVVANICSDWGSYTFLTQIPSYMNDVLKFDIAVVCNGTSLGWAALAERVNGLMRMMVSE